MENPVDEFQGAVGHIVLAYKDRDAGRLGIDSCLKTVEKLHTTMPTKLTPPQREAITCVSIARMGKCVLAPAEVWA